MMIKQVATARIVGLNCSLNPTHIWIGIVVFSKPADKTQTPAFKGNKVRELLGNYTVEMVFDDDKRNLEEIESWL